MKTTSFFLVALVLVLAGCGGNAAEAPATDGAPGQMFVAEGDYAASHILIAYQGALRAAPHVTRTKEEARARALSLIEQLRDDPSRFEQLAREASDGPSGPQGGRLGTWQRGQMAPAFEAAVDSLAVGAITPVPVETPFGYHVIRRDDLRAPHYGAEAFFIGFQGSPHVPPSVTRTQEAADSLARALQPDVNAETFDAYAEEYNDFGDAAIFLGGLKESDPLPEGLLETLQGLDYGEVGGPVLFPAIGYAFVRRVALEQYAGSHILIAYQGAERAGPEVTRSKEEAYARAKELIARLEQDPSRFAAMAAQYSDGPTAAAGGDLGRWFKGQMIPAFDEALARLQVGQIAPEPVETPFGYHVIRRNAVE
ncbi:peptidylprolyl isomerase [Rhodocaloribacter litoris]|uniref:peptidylprolyl isomerase n=1 Tax=Rhodocaloribacter litoris TaxID=2558931 RepID=UPI00141EB19A|nr:peptidylprolyl isomerase [Rhodocaloribacter litoris]QXD17070.1 peptidylprolyl isomerase [Rhodocaloribacter litoris]